ncbi:MAG: hypothetical protein IKL11_04485, partial [Muribaculaceae bacterium]|nr:hypothetical protein [Muribaculaceae bacterium]
PVAAASQLHRLLLLKKHLQLKQQKHLPQNNFNYYSKKRGWLIWLSSFLFRYYQGDGCEKIV